MPIPNYTTKIDSGKTVGEITQLLANHNAERIMLEYEDKLPVGVTFQVSTAKGVILFKLPANWQGVLAVLQSDGNVPRAQRTKEQALRTSWRILLYWVEAQMAMVEAELAKVDQVFLPYAVHKDGATVYEKFKSDNFLKLDQ